jgi:hypothetical protein
LKINKEKLQQLFDANQDKKPEYTKESWNAFHSALLEAKAVLLNPQSTLEEVVAAKISLQAAVEGLTENTSV